MTCATCQHRQRSTCTQHRKRVRKTDAACQEYVGVLSRPGAVEVLRTNATFARWIEELRVVDDRVVIRFRKGTPTGIKQATGYLLAPGRHRINKAA